MTYLQMLRLKYGVLTEADDEEDENKKKQNNEEEEEEDEPDTPDDGGGEEQTEEEPTEEEEEDEPDTPADTPDDGTEQQDTTEPETTGEDEEDEPDTPEGGDENTPAEQNDDVETGETDEDEPDVPDTGEENPEGGETTDDGGEETDNNSNKDDIDEVLFDTLSDEEKQNKILELKGNFKNMYITCDNVINKINDIYKNSENIKILQRIVVSLTDLKTYIQFYITNVFNGKSYFENDVMFNKYLAILNGIKSILQQIEKGVEKEND